MNITNTSELSLTESVQVTDQRYNYLSEIFIGILLELLSEYKSDNGAILRILCQNMQLQDADTQELFLSKLIEFYAHNKEFSEQFNMVTHPKMHIVQLTKTKLSKTQTKKNQRKELSESDYFKPD